jgi:ATP citrate (pro-S)-lyase
VLFHHEGGVEVGDVDAKANKVKVDIADSLSAELAATLVSKVPQEKQK